MTSIELSIEPCIEPGRGHRVKADDWRPLPSCLHVGALVLLPCCLKERREQYCPGFTDSTCTCLLQVNQALCGYFKLRRCLREAVLAVLCWQGLQLLQEHAAAPLSQQSGPSMSMFQALLLANCIL